MNKNDENWIAVFAAIGFSVTVAFVAIVVAKSLFLLFNA